MSRDRTRPEKPFPDQGIDAVLFDLLSALLDSWSLWNAIAGDEATGLAWRRRYLELTRLAGRYRPYDELVAEAALDVGLTRGTASTLFDRWDALEPWPEAPAVVEALHHAVPIGVVTNCSEELGRRAVNLVAPPSSVVVTAERAGWYKPNSHPYQLALEEIQVPPQRTLFVAGSPFDVLGASRLGMPVIWHNRLNVVHAEAAAKAARVTNQLDGLIEALD